MHFSWNPNTIRWYLNAEKYTGFYKNIAETVKPMLDGCKTLCDLGCGLALFDFEISPFLDKIDCFDINEAALTSVNERLIMSGINNIKTHNEDCGHIDGQWDVAYMSYFGNSELDKFLPLCKKLISIVSVTAQTEMFPSKKQHSQKYTVDHTIQYLTEKNTTFNLTYIQLEFGQPFTTKHDACRFLDEYSSDITDVEIEEFFSKRLIKTGRDDYPLYIPRTKSVGIFELDGELK